METTQDPTKKQKALMKDMKKVKAIQPAPIITYGPYTFEGVDYTDMPQNFYDTYHDCYYEHLRCIRFRYENIPYFGQKNCNFLVQFINAF